MTQEAFLRELEEALEIGANSLDEAKALQDVESWDSMSALIFMGLADGGARCRRQPPPRRHGPAAGSRHGPSDG